MQPEQKNVTVPEAMRIGLEHQQAGRLAEAERIYRQVLQLNPNQPDALNLLALIAHNANNNEIALELIGRAVLTNPANPYFLNNLGEVQRGLSRPQEAVASFDQALRLKPDLAEALSNRGGALQELGRHAEAVTSYDCALAVKPGFAEAFNNRGNALQFLGRYDEAVADYDQALSVRRGYAEALSNRGNSLLQLKRYDDALASYDQALAINPDYATVHWNQSLCRLTQGDFARGWEQYEWRWKCSAFRFSAHEYSRPLWLGKENISGKTILLHAEQGLGDTIQFARYAQTVEQAGATAILEVQPALKSLLSGIAGAHAVVGEGDALPAHDYHCPLLSLPLAFNARLETIPPAIPYLRPSTAAVNKWKSRLGRRHLPRVGIVGSGSLTHPNDRNRSIELGRLAALAGLGVQLISLQREVRPAEASVLAANDQVAYFGAELQDFSDTSALVSLMDVVISVDTAVAHLAGAMGKPVWILLPFAADWRWLVDRDDSPWYPTARLFRQPRIADWDSVIGRVRQQLQEQFT